MPTLMTARDHRRALGRKPAPLVAGVEAPLSLVDRALLSSARLARCDAFNAGMSISTLEWSLGS